MIGICEICDKKYYCRLSHWKRVKKHFCSILCRGLGQRGINNPHWNPSWIKICIQCKQEYRYCGDGIKRKKGKKFCSRVCMGQWKHEHYSVNCKCRICGIDIVIKKSIFNRGNENCCSYVCSNKLHSSRMDGSNNPNWQNGIGKLPWGWEFNKKLKKRIKERDNFRCRLCLKTKDELPKTKGYGLMIHHIDYNKMNNQENNLITLCNACHGKMHYNRFVWKEKLCEVLKK